MFWNVRPPLSDKPLSIDGKTVDAWQIRLSDVAPDVSELSSLLSPDELQTVGNFYFKKDQLRFIATRGFLRNILALYLDAPPAELQFAYSEFGKPSLSSDFASTGLRFNVSHAGDMALFAVAYNREVGVDVEQIRADFEFEPIAENFFSAPEVGNLRAIPLDARPRAFFECWTRKEALIKARGEGLSYPLNRFTVSFGQEEEQKIEVYDDPEELYPWGLCSLSFERGYVGAVAATGYDWKLEMRELVSVSKSEKRVDSNKAYSMPVKAGGKNV
jgi:4'-phosphopantetheinyl transferase